MGSWVEELPSGKFQGRYTLPNGKKRSAGTFEYESRARKAAAVEEAKANALGWRDPRAATRPWGDWCEEWWPTRAISDGTLKREVSPLNKHLKPKWKDVALIDITRHDVKAWIADLLKSGLSPRSVRRYVNIFTASLTAAVDAEILTAHPALKIKFDNGEVDVRRYLKRKESDRLMSCFPEKDEPLVNTLLGTGMRWGEAMGLQIKRVDFKRGKIRVAQVWDARNMTVRDYPKGRRIRSVQIPDWLEPHLREAIGTRQIGFVFAERHDIDNWRKRVWDVAVKDAGIEHARIHDLRHTYASNLLQAGVSLAEVGRLLGHVSAATTQIYAHLAETPKSAVTKALKAPRRVNVGKSRAGGPVATLDATGT